MAFASPKSLWGRVLLALQTHIRAIQLAGIPTDNAVIQKLPYNLRQLKPGFFISPVP